jgi:hypothetical protein
MSLAIIDAREWQNMFDLRSGKKRDARGPIIRMVQEVLERRPYPGDIDAASNRWVTDSALDLIDKYHPQFAFLTFAQQHFAARYLPMSAEERAEMVSAVFEEVNRFVKESGFEYVVVGTGDMTPLLGVIDVSRLDGLAVLSHWSARYAGIYGPSAGDLKMLEAHPFMERIADKDEFFRLFDGGPAEALRVPDRLAVAKEGYTFKGAGATMRVPLMIPASGFRVPVSTALGPVQTITGIRGLIEGHLETRKVALIMLEGVGMRDFLWPASPCENGKGWYYYEPGDGQYLAITTGNHRRVFDYPPGYKYFDEPGQGREYPLSGYFRSIPGETMGSSFAGRSIAVGNKSMFMHMVAGADISVECFARNLYNQGTMAVIHRHDKMWRQEGQL